LLVFVFKQNSSEFGGSRDWLHGKQTLQQSIVIGGSAVAKTR
jgi:hypothetical protein